MGTWLLFYDLNILKYIFTQPLVRLETHSHVVIVVVGVVLLVAVLILVVLTISGLCTLL